MGPATRALLDQHHRDRPARALGPTGHGWPDPGDAALQLSGTGRRSRARRQPAQPSRDPARRAPLPGGTQGNRRRRTDVTIFIPLAHAGHVLADAAIFLVPVGSVLLTIFALNRWGPED